MAPGELAGQRLDDVLGPEAAHVREVFDEVIRAAHAEQTANFAIPQVDGEKRSYRWSSPTCATWTPFAA